MTMFPDITSAYEWLDQHINYERNLGKVNYNARTFELDRFRGLLGALGNPHRGRRSIHIAGTRGKGSVTLALEALLRAQGFRTAVYLSPHLNEYRERIRLDGESISREGFQKHLEEVALVEQACEEETENDQTGFKTVFENLTAMFFLAAGAHQADWMVVETGLGGRLDATNVLDAGPVVLTRIGLEHTHLLGSTHEAIAGEKAGILKSGGWGVVGAQDREHQAIEVFKRRAREMEAELLHASVICPLVETQFHAAGMKLRYRFRRQILELELPLYGTFLAENLQNALAMFGALADRGEIPSPELHTIASALGGLKLPGRMEFLAELNEEPTKPRLRLIADSGHCPTGAKAVADSMKSHFEGQTACAVVGMAEEKDHAGFFRELGRWGGWRRIICFEMASPRAASVSALCRAAEYSFPRVERAKDLTEALQFAMLNTEGYNNVIVAGSAYNIAAAARWGEQYGRRTAPIQNR